MKLPYHINTTTELGMILLLIANVVASFYFYAHFPERVPIHWNIEGQPDNWGSPLFAAFFFPILIIVIYLLITFLPLADPKKEKYQQFNKAYTVIRTVIVLMMTYFYFTASLNGIGYNIPIDKATPLGVGLLFIVLGNFLPKIKQNWFVGIRTPWTLSNHEVWQKTHRVGGKLFILAGILMVAGIFLPSSWWLPIFIAVMVMIILGTIGYSWWLWKQSKKPDGKNQNSEQL